MTYPEKPSRWKEVSEERYWEMLEILPPAVMDGKGFMVGEAWTHRTCSVTKVERASYSAFAEKDGRYYECLDPMSVPEWRSLNLDDIKVEEEAKPA